jgi:hypothetical protein
MMDDLGGGRFLVLLRTFDHGIAAVARQGLAACLIVCTTWLGGCVVGQSLPVGYTPTPSTTATTATGVAVAVTVRDERPYVTSGDKPVYFLGTYRAAIGLPWDVTTKGKQPLAALFETHLAVELRSLGYAVVPRPDASRVLDVAIQDWNFDAYLDGNIWYELSGSVLSPDGTALARSHIKESQPTKGNFWTTGGKAGVEAAMPDVYAGAIRKLVRDNPDISAALSGGTAAP